MERGARIALAVGGVVVGYLLIKRFTAPSSATSPVATAAAATALNYVRPPGALYNQPKEGGFLANIATIVKPIPVVGGVTASALQNGPDAALAISKDLPQSKTADTVSNAIATYNPIALGVSGVKSATHFVTGLF